MIANLTTSQISLGVGNEVQETHNPDQRGKARINRQSRLSTVFAKPISNSVMLNTRDRTGSVYGISSLLLSTCIMDRIGDTAFADALSERVIGHPEIDHNIFSRVLEELLLQEDRSSQAPWKPTMDFLVARGHISSGHSPDSQEIYLDREVCRLVQHSACELNIKNIDTRGHGNGESLQDDCALLIHVIQRHSAGLEYEVTEHVSFS